MDNFADLRIAQHWVVDAINLEPGLSNKDIQQAAKDYGTTFIAVNKTHGFAQYRLDSEGDGFDFAFAVLDWGIANGDESFQYIEQLDERYYFSVTVHKKQLTLGAKTTKATLSIDPSLPVYSPEKDGLSILDVDVISCERLSKTLQISEQYQYLPVGVVLKRNESLRRALVIVFSTLLALCAVILLWPSNDSRSVIQDTVDPWGGYHSFLNDEARNPYPRVYQHAVFTKLFKAHPKASEWEISQVSYNKNSTAYKLSPKEEGSEALIRDLKKFVKEREVSSLGPTHVLVKESEVQLVMGANSRRLKYFSQHTIPNDLDSRVELLRDSIQKYIPNSHFTLVEKKPHSGGRWVTQTVIIDLSGVYIEDILSLGSLVADLPVSFGFSNEELVGQFEVAKADGVSRYKGRLGFTVFGE